MKRNGTGNKASFVSFKKKEKLKNPLTRKTHEALNSSLKQIKKLFVFPKTDK